MSLSAPKNYPLSDKGKAGAVAPAFADKVLDILKEHFRENPIKRGELAIKIFGQPMDDKQRQNDIRRLRTILHYLCSVLHKQIAFTLEKPAGYFWVRNEQEKLNQIALLEKYAESISIRKNVLVSMILDDTESFIVKRTHQPNLL